MKKDDRPEAFGVFKPVGHVVVSFPPDADLDSAIGALRDAGFDERDVVRYTPQEMVAQVDAELATASPISSVGQEQNLVKAHRALAQQGYSFLVVDAASDDRSSRVAEVARRFHAERAQKYGTFIIEELLESPEDHQVAESNARGLDAQTMTGREEDRARRHH